MIETFELPVACNGDTHRVEIRVDARQRVRCVLHDHDQVVEDVLEALGGPATACSLAEGAVRSLRSQVPSAADRVAWVRLGVTAPFLYAGWQSAGVTSPRMAKRWLRVVSASEPAAVGWDVWTKVLDWKLRGFATPTSAGPWARAGCHPLTARQWVAAGQTVAGAQEWFDFGVDTPAEVAGWRALGAHLPQETAQWLAAGVCSGTEALLWSKLGVTHPAHVVRWLSAGAIDADDVLLWVRCGIDISGGVGPEAVEDWLQATSSGNVAPVVAVRRPPPARWHHPVRRRPLAGRRCPHRRLPGRMALRRGDPARRSGRLVGGRGDRCGQCWRVGPGRRAFVGGSGALGRGWDHLERRGPLVGRPGLHHLHRGGGGLAGCPLSESRVGPPGPVVRPVPGARQRSDRPGPGEAVSPRCGNHPPTRADRSAGLGARGSSWGAP